jgi:hypothetical protein
MAEFKLTMKHPHFPDGMEIEVDGIGAVKNGESITVTQEMADSWSAQNQGLDFKKSLAQNGAVEFHGKDKLMDKPLGLADLQAEDVAAQQAAKNEGGEN